MKLRSERNLDDNQERSAGAGPVSETTTDPFQEGEQTLTRPYYHHHSVLEEPGEDLEREEIGRTEDTSERSEVEDREKILFKTTSNSEIKSNKWRKQQLLWSNKSLYDECIASLRNEGLPSIHDHPELGHSNVDFTPSPRNEQKTRKRCSTRRPGRCQMG